MIDRAWRALLLVMTILLVSGAPILAQSDDPGLLRDDDGSVLVGIRNDVTLPAGAVADAVFVVQGTAIIEGATKGLVAIDSAVTITGTGASVDSVFIVGGTLDIADGATVRDVAYADTAITGQELVTGEVRDARTDVAGAAAWFATVVAVILFFVFIGWLIAVLVSSLLLVAFGTSQARRAAANIGGDTLKTIVAGLIMLILPWIVIGLLFVTVVGIPLAIGLLVLWGFTAFLGWLVAGLWLGQLILSRSRTAARPYGAAFLGTIVLMLISLIPLVGPIMSLLGLGAVTLAGWRVLRAGGTPPAAYGYGGQWGQPYQVPPPPYAAPPYAPPPPPPPPGYWPPQQGGPPASWPQG
jgi:hypothetical protein